MDHLAKEKKPTMPNSLLLYNLIVTTIIVYDNVPEWQEKNITMKGLGQIIFKIP